VDGDHYEVQYRQTGQTDWTTQTVGWDQLSFTAIGLALATSYDFQVRAVNGAAPGTPSAWSGTTTYSTGTDVTPPGQPDVPTVAASLVSVQVTHDLGLNAGGTYNLPPDMSHLEVHLGSSSGFTPSGLTLAGKLLADYAMIVAHIPAVGTFTTASTGTVWVKVVAVDTSGNRSAASSAASSTATLIDDAHISSLTASKITAGTITAAVIIGGSATFSGTLSAATGTFSGTLSASPITGSSISGGTISGTTISGATVIGGTIETASSGARVVMDSSTAQRITFYDASGNNGYVQAQNTYGSNEIGVYSGSGTSFMYANSASCSINGSAGIVSASSSGWTAQSTGGTAFASGSGSTLTVQAGSSISIGGGGYGTTITLGDSGSSLGLGSATINLSNITGHAASTSLTMVGRQLYFVSSTQRNKVDVQAADIPVRDVLALRPVTFLDRGDAVRAGSTEGLARHLGLIAEEVDEIPSLAPLLVIRDDDGLPMSLGYDRLPVAQQVVILDHEARLRDLLERVTRLEGQVA